MVPPQPRNLSTTTTRTPCAASITIGAGMQIFILERYCTGECVSIRTRLRQGGSRVFEDTEQTGVVLAVGPPSHVLELAQQGTNGIGSRLERSIAMLHGDRRGMREN